MNSALLGMNQERFFEEVEAYPQTFVDTAPEPLLILDTNTRIRSTNRAFYQTFQTSPGETRNRILHELGNGQWNIPELRTVLVDFVLGSLEFNDFELEHVNTGVTAASTEEPAR
jgi:PAS domain-containing protein